MRPCAVGYLRDHYCLYIAPTVAGVGNAWGGMGSVQDPKPAVRSHLHSTLYEKLHVLLSNLPIWQVLFFSHQTTLTRFMYFSCSFHILFKWLDQCSSTFQIHFMYFLHFSSTLQVFFSWSLGHKLRHFMHFSSKFRSFYVLFMYFSSTVSIFQVLSMHFLFLFFICLIRLK